MDQNETKRPGGEKVALDDERRVKVLSPGAMVAKRFFRNKLAMVGLCILIAMFLFSFVGGLVSPYGEKQVFESYETMSKEYAGVTRNSDFRYAELQEGTLSADDKSQFLLAVSSGESTFSSGETVYAVIPLTEDTYTIGSSTPVVEVAKLKGQPVFTDRAGVLTQEMQDAYVKATAEGLDTFTVGSDLYVIQGANKFTTINRVEPAAVATRTVLESIGGGKLDYDFTLAALEAKAAGKTSFTAGGKKYKMEIDDEAALISLDGEEFATLSPYVIRAVENGTVISGEMRALILEAVENGETSVHFTNENGEEETLEIRRKNEQFMVRRDTQTKLIMIYSTPSKEHWLGTDGNGMDILTRLMYGGRVSLMIGFVVIIIETLIGVVLGGIAGYFGGWVDNLIMRLVDIFNCIPTWPILIIIGSIMDAQKVGATTRIYIMMLILGVLGWPGTARMVRGQILSLREQEFMIAAEATGISVSRRIFRHLIPNVIPQLIVICTMGLGGIILTESTMSFLGLGVKFPYASWGNIIQAVSSVYVMTNYWFVWIPAGFLILITVLGFNFVGDGLRDAFDPRMKR
ncbi:MAG: ABC transporter permease [Oscillospiraceae bacterium]|nr:ABC transporter permease [Oscillospiraceae bacterium]